MATKLKAWQKDDDGRVATNCGGIVNDPGPVPPLPKEATEAQVAEFDAKMRERAISRNRPGRVFVNDGEPWSVAVLVGGTSIVVAEGVGGAVYVRARHEKGGKKPLEAEIG